MIATQRHRQQHTARGIQRVFSTRGTGVGYYPGLPRRGKEGALKRIKSPPLVGELSIM